jgi:hypothetical protein
MLGRDTGWTAPRGGCIPADDRATVLARADLDRAVWGLRRRRTEAVDRGKAILFARRLPGAVVNGDPLRTTRYAKKRALVARLPFSNPARDAAAWVGEGVR